MFRLWQLDCVGNWVSPVCFHTRDMGKFITIQKSCRPSNCFGARIGEQKAYAVCGKFRVDRNERSSGRVDTKDCGNIGRHPAGDHADKLPLTITQIMGHSHGGPIKL
jgi:hypothetical protein